MEKRISWNWNGNATNFKNRYTIWRLAFTLKIVLKMPEFFEIVGNCLSRFLLRIL